MMLKDLDLQPHYNSEENDIINEFYNPTLNVAKNYDRAVGYFSLSSLLNIMYGIEKMIENKGKIRIICSPQLSSDDIDMIRHSYELKENKISNALFNEIEANPLLNTKEFLLFSKLLELDVIELKIAFKRNLGIYHEKLGIIKDGSNSIAFIGSLNETASGLTHNFESFDVYLDWEGTREEYRVKEKINHFEKLWNNEFNSLEIIEFPQAVKERMITLKNEIIKKSNETKELDFKIKNDNEITVPSTFSPRYYQEEAYLNWKYNNFKGLFTMATGTGKTLTALYCLQKLNQRINDVLLTVIVCPYQHLVEQWCEDIELFNIDPIKCYSEYSKWHQEVENNIRLVNGKVISNVTIVCTNNTFTTTKMQKYIDEFKCEKFIIIDEAHNAGSKSMINTLSVEKYEYKLGLSATPERHRAEEETTFIKEFFVGEVFTFGLQQAIEQGFLCEYYYYPIIARLNQVEQEEYDRLSLIIAKNMIEKNGVKIPNEYAKLMLIRRARVIAGAKDKLVKLRELIQGKQKEHNILVYCGATKVMDEENDNQEDAIRQITEVTKILGLDFDMAVSKYTSDEDAYERKSILDRFNSRDLQAIVAIKCLDEGVNIPSIEKAIILASTTNPKEYIQRRGRVLRQSKKTGKKYAYIYDMITLPFEGLEYNCKSLITSELNRVIEFGGLAKNGDEVIEFTQNLNSLYNITISDDKE